MLKKVAGPLIALSCLIMMALYFASANAGASNADLEKIVKQDNVMILAVVDYIGKLQELKILPNGNDLDKKK